MALAALAALAVPLAGLLPGPFPAAADGAATGAGPARRPNIVMVMADDLRVDDLRYMPHVRHLVGGRGLQFRNSFSPYPLCCPARASFLTGLYAHNHHVFSHRAPWGFKAFDDHATIGTALQRSGYRTAFVGKYLNGYGAQPSLVTGKPSWHYVPPGWTDWYGAVQRPAHSRYRSGGTYNYWHTIFNVNGRTDDSHRGRYQTNVLGAFARRLVTRYSRSPKPFFMYLSAVAPHFGSREKGDPRRVERAPGVYTKFETPGRPRWVRGRFDSAIRRAPGMPVDGGPSEADMSDKPREMAAMPELNAREKVALTEVARQRAESEFVLDQQVGRLVATLRRTGELANTVIMFTSDNGYFMGEHRQRTGKIKAHEPSLRVPFLVAGPGIPHGERFDPITTEDVTATVADLAGATTHLPYPPDGVSVRDTITDGDRGWTLPVLTEGMIGAADPETPARRERGFADPRDTIGLRTARYKYIRYSDGEGELYDLDRDPNELDSVFGDPAYALVQSRLDDLWWRYKDCAGPACSVPLPADLQRGPVDLRTLTDQQSRGVQQRYGYWR